MLVRDWWSHALDEWDYKDTIFWGYVAFALTGIVLYMLFKIFSMDTWSADKWSALANWAQAFGAVIAIIAGFSVARYQLNKQFEAGRAAAANAVRLQIISAYLLLENILEEKQGLVQSPMQQGALSDGHIIYAEASLKSILESLNSFAVTAQPSKQALEISRIAAHNIIGFLHILDRLKEVPENRRGNVLMQINKYRDGMTTFCKSCIKWIKEKVEILSTEQELKLRKKEIEEIYALDRGEYS